MLPDHRNIQKWIKKKYGAQFTVLAECVDGQNCLPDEARHWYQPDVVLKSRQDPNDIRYIIEVEHDPIRKAIVGACLLADCSVEEMKGEPAELIFIVYSESGKRQISNFIQKVDVIKKRFKHLSSIRVVTDEDFKHSRGVAIRSHS
jgi:hypothetical protein